MERKSKEISFPFAITCVSCGTPGWWIAAKKGIWAYYYVRREALNRAQEIIGGLA